MELSGLHHGDCVEVMAQMPAASVDAIVCDPPYGIGFMGKEWDNAARLGSVPPSALEPKQGTAEARGAYPRTGKGPEAVAFDGSAYQAWTQRWATEALRVAKPGAYLLAFGGTRTYHRLACAIEDAGWIIRDCLVWAYAQGFPKSRALLKPAWEPIVMARKPGPLRELAIDECRIGMTDADKADVSARINTPNSHRLIGADLTVANYTGKPRPEFVPAGRWPANVILTDPIFDGDVDGVVGGGETRIGGKPHTVGNGSGERGDVFPWGGIVTSAFGDTGTYSRFFQLPEVSGCYLCGRARSADESSSQRSPSAASVLSPARTEASSAAATTTDSPITSGTATPSLSDDAANTPHILRSRQHAIWPGSEPESSPARSTAAASPVIGTTTTTADHWTCGTCADLTTSPGTNAESPDAPRFLLIPKADRADREPNGYGRMVGGLEERPIELRLTDKVTAKDWGDPDAKVYERNTKRANVHPTVKPLELMRHLVRLVTPAGGTVLDPFLGSGTTAIAAEMEGFAWIGIEREAEYVAIAEARLAGVQRGMGLSA